MEISPYMLTLLLVYSFLFGVFCGGVNDVFKITRALLGDGRELGGAGYLYNKEIFLVGKLSQNKKSPLLPLLIFIEDFILVVFIGCGVVVLNYYLNRGQFRLYTLTAVAAGFALYYFTVGKLVALVFSRIVFLVRAALAILLKLCLYPIKLTFDVIKKIFTAAVKKIRFAIEKRRVMRYNKKEREALIEVSKSGFMIEAEKEGKTDEI